MYFGLIEPIMLSILKLVTIEVEKVKIVNLVVELHWKSRDGYCGEGN